MDHAPLQHHYPVDEKSVGYASRSTLHIPPGMGITYPATTHQVTSNDGDTIDEQGWAASLF
ncbi:hypothetical protein [Phytopseudomonas daroniae]|uniref:hypothetical protein n=1 Tax=Phytopseudomonas daroniae TaxID=2487519 RepID=UPI00103831B4|nr:hypothetical protein [Pseudomonas daroniae]